MADALDAAFTAASAEPPQPAMTPTAASRKADARDRARLWVMANRPDLARKFGSLTELIEFFGDAHGWDGGERDRALAAAEPAMLDTGVSDPWAWTLAKLKADAKRTKPPDPPIRRLKPAAQRPNSTIHGEV